MTLISLAEAIDRVPEFVKHRFKRYRTSYAYDREDMEQSLVVALLEYAKTVPDPEAMDDDEVLRMLKRTINLEGKKVENGRMRQWSELPNDKHDYDGPVCPHDDGVSIDPPEPDRRGLSDEDVAVLDDWKRSLEARIGVVGLRVMLESVGLGWTDEEIAAAFQSDKRREGETAREAEKRRERTPRTAAAVRRIREREQKRMPRLAVGRERADRIHKVGRSKAEKSDAS